jgi:hypothetical protein
VSEVDLHPSVAALVATLTLREGGLTFEAAAIPAFLTQTRALDAAGRDAVVVHLIAWMVKAKGLGAPENVLGVVVALVLEVLGDASRAADAFDKAGFAQAAALIGHTQALRAPAAAPPPSAGASVKAKRGLVKSVDKSDPR